MRVLHITPWYPTPDMPGNGIFIQRHIEAIGLSVQQTILHIDLARGQQPNSSCQQGNLIRVSESVQSRFWRWYEFRFYRLLRTELIKIDAANQYSHVIFHIAYPTLIFIDRLNKYLPKKKLISEHWSAYRLNFNSNKKLSRIQNIFYHRIPLTVVSKELGESIRQFSQIDQEYRVIPNVVHPDFYFKSEVPREKYFFSAAWWKAPKVPAEVLHAISNLKDKGVTIVLHIAGDGPLIDSMKQYVKHLKIEDRIIFRGRLETSELAIEMNRAIAFIMPTNYETFSVGCAEALVCGCPVIANRVGAIPELVNDSNGQLIDENNSWESVLSTFNLRSVDRKIISEKCADSFTPEMISSTFLELLTELK